MSPFLPGLPVSFPALLDSYYSQIVNAIKRHSHHDHRRALLMEFLRESFDIGVDEIELEKKIKAAEVRGRIDAFYKFVIFEVKIDLERERPDALQELKKYFESRPTPSDYIAAVTDGLKFEIYDYNPSTRQPKEVRRFEISVDQPGALYSELDELLAAGRKVPPSSDDIVVRFGLHSISFQRSARLLGDAYRSVASDPSVEVKLREWNALLSKVYGSAIGNDELFLKHTYLAILSRSIVTMALFPRHTRSPSLYRDLLTGEFFRSQGLVNLAEPDFFSWCLDTVAEGPFLEFVNAIFRRLGEFDWKRVDKDLLKMLYQELVDPSDRSGLGEFYTPDWLAELMLEDLRYDRESLLDPSCGSGTFLFTAIRRLRRNGMHGKELVQFVMDSIIGLDVHPVAVLMAKANVLLALAPELTSKRDYEVSVRVYMADTLQTVEKKGKNYLAVPDGMGREFTIPIRSLEFNRDIDQIIDQMSAFARRGTASTALADQAQKGFLAKIKDLTAEEKNFWNFNFSLMVDLIRQRRDTVWAFILKNAFRPAFLRRTKVDVIVGNPPWLSFRDIAEDSYKARIKELTFGYGLQVKSSKNLFTQMDTSTLFFVHCREEFLKQGGRIAFVMPKTTILPAKQHAGFQREGLSRIDDLSKVTVTGLKNQHFFNVKSCVVVLDGPSSVHDIPLRKWSGVLPRKNLTLGQSRHLLFAEESTHDFLQTGEAASPYYDRAIQGATLNPHTLWFIEPDTQTALNTSRPLVRTAADAFRLCKEKKWKLRLKGPLESKFLFSTAVSDDILPFFVRALRLTVLPVLVREGGLIMVQSDEILAEGYPDASDWVAKAEKIFAKNTKDSKMTARERLDYQHLLTAQNPAKEFVVLYNKSGTNVCAAYLNADQFKEVYDLTVQGFVAESVTYRIYVDSEDEAHYLSGILNSSVVNLAIKPYQTEGVYHGKRDIHGGRLKSALSLNSTVRTHAMRQSQHVQGRRNR